MILGKSYVTEIDVPFDEIDEGGVVYHAHYLTLCDRVRNRVLKKIELDYEHQFEKDLVFAVVECHAYYLKAVKMGEHYVATRLLSGSRSSLVVRQAMFPEKPDGRGLEAAGDEIQQVESCLFFADFHLVALSIRHNMAVVPIPANTRKVLGLEVLSAP